jgi:GNAT superfamily N-acetyltransferase
MSITVRPENNLKNDPRFYILVVEYEKEKANLELGAARWDIKAYEKLHEEGKYFAVGAYDEDKLIGFGGVLVSVLPHYNKLVATIETIFLKEEYRKGRTGVKMVQELENLASQAGAQGVYFTTGVGDRLSKLPPLIGYHPTNEVFFKALNP